MNEIIEKLSSIKNKILSEKGGLLRFFGLLARMDMEGKWDLLISADWVKKNTSEEDLVYVINKLKEAFSDKLDFLFRIVLLAPDEPFICELARAINRENSGQQPKELTSLKISEDFHIKQVIVLALNFEGMDLEATSKKIESIEPIGAKEVRDF